jgi:type IV pilus assembly protein PilC
MLGLSIISASALKIVTKHSTRSHYFIDKNLLGIMLLGPLIKKSIIARSSRTLATLLNAGTPLTEALASVANTASNILYQQAFNQIRHRVISGQCLHAAMASISENALFPSEFRQMIRVGEETASLTRMLDKIAEYYEEEVDQTLSNTSQLMEPLIMLILGSIVGCFVVALYMPIFKLGSVF